MPYRLLRTAGEDASFLVQDVVFELAAVPSRTKESSVLNVAVGACRPEGCRRFPSRAPAAGRPPHCFRTVSARSATLLLALVTHWVFGSGFPLPSGCNGEKVASAPCQSSTGG